MYRVRNGLRFVPRYRRLRIECRAGRWPIECKYTHGLRCYGYCVSGERSDSYAAVHVKNNTLEARDPTSSMPMLTSLTLVNTPDLLEARFWPVDRRLILRWMQVRALGTNPQLPNRPLMSATEVEVSYLGWPLLLQASS
jgi:hypothetical protein